ncbi:MAG: TerD family protein, partial [Rhodococcus sp. (in: high G+C Gram-positive bacteria)]
MTYPVELSKGQNIEFPDDLTHVDILLGWDESDRDVDASALLLIGGRVASDDHFVFYNQPTSLDGSVKYLGRSRSESGPQERISIGLDEVPDDIETIAIAGSTDSGTFGDLGKLHLRVVDAAGAVVANYSTADADTETAFTFAEVYRRAGRWKLRAVGQGWATGLAGLAGDFGVSVDDESDATIPTSDPVTEPDAEPADTMRDIGTSADAAASSPERAPRRKRGVTTAKPAARSVSLPQFDLRDNDSWQPARLFSVVGVGSGDEQERRATAALVSTMQAVRPFARAICSRLGAPVGRFEGYIEVSYTKGDGKVIPDAVLRVVRGSKIWTALVEVKTGNGQLGREQLENYLDVARRQKYDTVVSLSNDIPAGAGELPVEVDRRKLAKVALRHLSWADVTHEARMLLAHGGIDDGLQAWLLSEFLRYLAHPRSGAAEFTDMGRHWVNVRDSAAAGTVRAGDVKAAAVA